MGVGVKPGRNGYRPVMHDFSFPSGEGRNKQQEKLRNISHDTKSGKSKLFRLSLQ